MVPALPQNKTHYNHIYTVKHTVVIVGILQAHIGIETPEPDANFGSLSE